MTLQIWIGRVFYFFPCDIVTLVGSLFAIQFNRGLLSLSIYTLLYLKGENSLFSTHVVWNKIVLEFSRGWCCAIVSLWILILPPCRDLLAILNPVCRPHGNSANAHANSLVSNLLYFVLADMITNGFWIAANREAPGYLKQNVYWAKASLVL